MPAALAYVAALLLVALAVPFAHRLGRAYAGYLANRPEHSCTDTAPYGVGPCGVARVTYPALHGLLVTER